jgi:hypothetical protein
MFRPPQPPLPGTYPQALTTNYPKVEHIEALLAKHIEALGVELAKQFDALTERKNWRSPSQSVVSPLPCSHNKIVGRSKTLELLHRQYHWPKMRGDVERYVRNCHTVV